jgi:RNA polymerase sigma-70 factor, ECF subfamily
VPNQPPCPAQLSGCDDTHVDITLVRAVLSGEERASEALLGRLRCLARFVGALNLRHGRAFDSHELADLVQDTLVIVWRKLDTFHGPEGLESWVLRIARFEFQNALRKRARRLHLVRPLEQGEDASDGSDFSSQAAERHSLAQVLALLEPAMEQTIRLKHFAGLTFVEIGVRMGCSPNTAKTRYYRALTQLAEALGDEAGA